MKHCSRSKLFSIRLLQLLNSVLFFLVANNDFVCRFLVVDDIWIPLAESMMIERFKPLWNRCIDGFGNHDPGSGRYQQQRSPWDCIHPGREWAEKLKPNAISREDWLLRVENYLSTYQAP